MDNYFDVDWKTIPQPVDDGRASHLEGTRLPSLGLGATTGQVVDLGALEGTSVVYVYPMTGQPGVALPEGWDLIPGARGCTPQSCAFRDHYAQLRAIGVSHLFGLSVQDSSYQAEAAARLHLPFALLSDHELKLTHALKLPTFTTAGMTLLSRLTLVLRDALIRKVFYPVFPPDQSAEQVMGWLQDHGPA